jgi:transcriptional regulator with XRE-family HTH domain
MTGVGTYHLRYWQRVAHCLICWRGPRNGKRDVALAMSEVRGIVERVCARQDVLAACAEHDLGAVITVLNAHGLTQGQIAGLTGIPQGRLSEYVHRKREPRASTTFEDFATGLGMPPAARRALGLAAEPSGDARISLAHSRQAPDLDAGLEYPDTPTLAAGNVSMLWRADLADQGALERGLINPAAWNDASLRWLVGPGSGPGTGADSLGGVRVGMGDVERFRATVQLFAQLDDRFGGGHARESLIQYLGVDGERLLRGRYPEPVGSALFSAVAEATLLAAWMTYDARPRSPYAQRYFIQALGLANAAGDRLLGAGILDAMSHQATYIGRFGEAANLARAARTGTSGIATATLTAHFHTMEARALARLGDAKACDRALAEAVREFERRDPDDDPAWFQYFDEAELSAEFGHCLRDLRRAGDAAQHASRSVGAAGDGTFARSDFFATMVLADAYLGAGEPEQACETALVALTAGEQIRSGRCVNYLREFREHLARAGDTAAVREFSERAVGSRLWRIASRTDRPAAVA